MEHVIVTMSLSVRGVSHYSKYDYDDLYDELYDYEGDVYEWLEDSHPRRGDIKIELTSPQGTKSILLPYRNYDFINQEGYDDWPFMSVHFWGENPVGTWTLKIHYKSCSGYVWMSGLRMTLHGTATIPTTVSSIPSHENTGTDPYNTPTDPSHNNISTDPSHGNTPTGSKKGNIVPITVGVTAGVVVITVSAVILSVVIVLLLRRRKMRSAGFVQLTSNEVEI